MLTAEDKTFINTRFNELHEKLDASEKKIIELQNEVGLLKQQLGESRTENRSLRRQLNDQSIHIDDLEQYGRRMSVRIEGVPLVEGEKFDNSKLFVEIKKKVNGSKC